MMGGAELAHNKTNKSRSTHSNHLTPILSRSLSRSDMSFQDHDGDDHRPLDLLDEYWFFSNTLNRNKKGNKQKLPPKSPSLVRTEDDEEEQQEAAAEVYDDLNWSSIYEGVLRTRTTASSSHGNSSRSSSALQRAPSMPVVPSSDHGRRKEKEAPSTPCNKLRHSHSTLERHCRSNYKQHLQANKEQKQTGRSSNYKEQKPPVMMARSKSAMFHQAADKKMMWKSSSDMESMEVQGFKDLGFVFDKEELRENLADVLPGLKNDDDHNGSVRRPYLSEAWHHDDRRQPPALIRVQSEARSSAEEMKDQLRMWAQAVACNVRQECV